MPIQQKRKKKKENNNKKTQTLKRSKTVHIGVSVWYFIPQCSWKETLSWSEWLFYDCQLLLGIRRKVSELNLTL
jgi:hypothetical protein